MSCEDEMVGDWGSGLERVVGLEVGHWLGPRRFELEDTTPKTNREMSKIVSLNKMDIPNAHIFLLL